MIFLLIFPLHISDTRRIRGGILIFPYYPTVIFSWGNFVILGRIPDSAANTSVRPPTRPQYIKTINTSLAAAPRVGVTPSVKPTVAIAEPASNKLVSTGSPSA